jgi:phospholipid/cholesterol/gamma-HCH transport system substrate-binding protein
VKNVSAGVKVGILVIAMVLGSYATWKSLSSDAAGDDAYKLSAQFRDASGLPVGSKVVVAGLPVGEITELGIEGRYARVHFRLRDDVPVFGNAVVIKKATSLLGEYYLEVDPGEAETQLADGGRQTNPRLKDGDKVTAVVEATSTDQLLRRIEETLPNVDEVLKSVRDLSEEVRQIVNGPVKSIATRIDTLVQKESQTVTDILAKADRSMARIDQITQDIRAITGGADERIEKILDNLDAASAEAKALMASAKNEVEITGTAVREKLDRVDEVIANTESITRKIDKDQGTLGRLVNDPAIADNVEQITDDAKGFLGTLFNIQTYVGLRSEYNVFSKLARHYVSIELHTRPDKYYLIEVVQEPRGNYPEVTLEFDPTNPASADGAWVRKSVIRDEIRFSFQFAKRFDWLTLRYGIKESTGGIGADIQGRWWNRSLRFSVDAFDATFDQLPRVKLSAAVEVFRYIYLLGGIDEVLNPPDELLIDTGNTDVPIQFEELRFGRDAFFGAMLRFNDEDLAALLTVGGSALAGVGGSSGD